MTQARPFPEEERRLVTILFADLVGYTSISEARDPELIMEALNLCFERLATEIQRFGGYVDKVVGDEIMALFGAPRAQEDDAGKAVAASLAMQRALAELTPQLKDRLGQGFSMRIGINTGLVVTGAVGPGGYTVTGDAVNVAARLEKATDPGTVLVGETTRRLARRQFAWGERQEFEVKGRTEPVVCFRAEGLALAPLRLVPAPSETPFVGRDEHLDQIRAAWERAASGPAQVLELVGESGIGKTRLLAHLFAEMGAQPGQVLYTRADTPPRTFGPLLQLLPTLRGSLPPGFEERIEVLARAHELATPPEVEPGWLVDGLTEIIARLATNRPVALVLDDMHRADGATVVIVERLLPRLASLPVLTLLLRQPVGHRVRRISDEQSITLQPLSAEQGRRLVAGVAPELAPDVRDQIVARAGGNPLYLEMLATATAAAPSGAAAPETLQTAIVARVDELEETSRQVLREASVFGQSFYEEAFKLTTTVADGLYDALAHLCQVGLLDELPDVPSRAYAFRHSLVQEVLYHGLLLRQRVELHRRAAEALELVQEEGTEVEPEQLAHHFQEAGDSERAAAYHLAAADRAEHLRAPMEARRHRRAANRLLNMASLAGLYAGQGHPSLVARGTAAAIQAGLAALLVLPVFLVFATRRPRPNVLTLGLPFEIIDFNVSSVLLAVVLGGLPLLLAGVVFMHLAVPNLMRRTVKPLTLVVLLLAGWAAGLACVVAGYGVLIGLLRLGALDDLSSMYVGGATLQILEGNYGMVLSVIIGTFLIAVSWTALLRLQARGWARLRRTAAGPRQIEEGRRWAALRQIGIMAAGVGGLTVALLAAYQAGVLPNSDSQPGLPAGAFLGLLVLFGLIGAAGAAAVLMAGRRLRATVGAYQLGLFGFEVPLLLALAFGVMAWFQMRQAVIVSADDVDTPGSVAAFDRAVSIFPDLSLAYYLRGERHLARHDFASARADFDEAIELDPDFAATYLARGRVLIELGEPEAALADGERLVELRPEHPAGYAIRAWAHAELGNLGEAGENIELAIRPLPEGTEAWDAFFVRCLALVAVGRLDEGEQDCLRVLELNPGHIVSLDELALIAFERGEYEQGLEYTTQVLEIDNENVIAWTNRGEAYSLLGMYQEAEEDLSRAIELDAEYARAYNERGFARLYLDRPEQALEDVNRAVELFEANPEQPRIGGLLEENLYATRLFVALYAGDYGTAIEDASTLEALGATSPWVLSTRGAVYLELGNLEQGLADIEGALALDADDAQAHDRRGYGYFLAGDYDRAQADLDTALLSLATLAPQERAEVHYHRALLFRALNRSEEAVSEITEAAALVEIPSVRRQIEEVRLSLPAQGAAGN